MAPLRHIESWPNQLQYQEVWSTWLTQWSFQIISWLGKTDVRLAPINPLLQELHSGPQHHLLKEPSWRNRCGSQTQDVSCSLLWAICSVHFVLRNSTSVLVLRCRSPHISRVKKLFHSSQSKCENGHTPGFCVYVFYCILYPRHPECLR